MKGPKISARPLDRLPEPYRSELFGTINTLAIDEIQISKEGEERGVRSYEQDLGNGGRERRRKQVLAFRKAMRKSGFRFVKVRNPLPAW